MGIVGCIPRFLKAHGGWVLTALSIFGLTGTAILVAKAAPEADRELQEEAELKEEQGGSLTFGEKFEIVAPHYLPAFIVYILTAGCMVGAQIFNVKQQAMLAAAYALLGQEYAQYRKAIADEYGHEADQKALMTAKAETKKLRDELAKMRTENGPFLYTIASLPGVIFESTPKDIYEALYHFSRNMNLGYGELSNLYDMIGLPCSLFNDIDGWAETSAGDHGWDAYENEVSWGSPEGYFKIDRIGEKDGKPIFLIDFSIPPYKLGLDYGSTDNSVDHIYEWYCPEEATRIARCVSDDEIVRFDPPDHYVLGF